MDNVKEEFLKIVKDYSLDFSECQDDIDMECRTDFYAKYPGVAGFLIESYWAYDKCIRVATNVSYEKDCGLYFWGNDAFYDVASARAQVEKMIKELKDTIVKNNLENMYKDFT